MGTARKATSVNLRMTRKLREKLEFLARDRGQGMSEFARATLERAIAADLVRMGSESEPVATPAAPSTRRPSGAA